MTRHSSLGVACSCAATLAAIVMLALAPRPLTAQTIIEDWAKVQLPPVPKIGPVEVEANKTALLILDFVKQACAERVPRCPPVLPKVRSLMLAARANGALIVYSHQPGAADTDFDPQVAPRAGDPVVVSGPNKFIGTALGQILRDKAITTVVVTGVRANGAVLYTAADAALNGYNVVVPVDTMAALTAYEEQFVAYNLINAPGMARVKLTAADGVAFK